MPKNTLTIQSGGSVESQGGIFYLGCPAKIYGSINATNVKVNIGTPEIYIGENGSIKLQKQAISIVLKYLTTVY